jgi:hypothetical protein
MATERNVPQAQVGQVVQDFIDDDEAAAVACTINPGTNPPTWTVTATSPGESGED